MAKAYLGKISALVTANTSDFNSKLNASAKEVRSFAASMQSALSRAESNAASSLRGIYTEAQKVERALKAAGSLRLSFKGIDAGSLDDATKRLQQLFSVTQGISKPLEAAAKSFGTLSSEVQAQFLPALISAQKATEAIAVAARKSGDVTEERFAAVEQRVNRTTAAMGRLKEASQAVGSLATGQELRFQRPDFVAETQRASRLQGEIASLRPQAIQDGGFTQLIAQQRAAAQETEKLASALEKARLSRNGDVAAATQAYNKQIALQRQLNDQIEREIELSRRAGEASSLGGQRTDISARLQAARAAEEEAAFRERAAEATEKQVSASNRLLAQEISRAAVLREQQQNFGSGIDTNVRAQSQNIFSGPRLEAAALRAETERLAEQFNALDAETRSLLQPLADRLNDAYQASLKSSVGVGTFADRVKSLRGELGLLNNTGLSSSIGGERTDISAWLAATKAAQEEAMFREQAKKAAQEEAMFLERAAEQSAKIADAAAKRQAIRDNFGAGIEESARPSGERLFGRRQETIDTELARTQRLDREFQSLPNAVQKQLDDEAQKLDNVARAARDGAASLGVLKDANDAMAASMADAKATIPVEELEKSARDAKQFAAGLREVAAAAAFGGRFADAFETAQIDSARAKVKLLSDLLIASGISGGRAARAIDRYAAALQNAASSEGGLRGAAAAIKQAESAAANAVAAVTGRSARDVSQRLARAGDIGRMGFDKFSLAAQQAGFAIDDFFSSTGGLEFKLRAVSNNITQLAFILGGTTGLFIGLATVIGGQVALAIAKFAFGLDDAKKRQEAMKAQAEALNATLDKQKNLVESLANAYRDLGRDIKQATLTPQEARFEDRQNRNREILGQQADRRREVVAGIVPSVAANRGRLQQLERQAQELPVGRERARLERQAAALRRREDEAFGRIDRAAAGRVGQNRGQLEQRRDFLAERLDNLQRDRNRIAQRSGEGDPRIQRLDATIQNVSEQLAEFTLALQRISDEAQATAFQFSGPLQDEIQRAQERLAAAFGDRNVAQQDILNQAGRRLGDIPDRVTQENLSPTGTRRAINEIEAFARPAIQATERLTEFANALNGAEESVRRADEQAKARVEELRAEVSRNPNDRGLQAQLRTAEAGAAEVARRRQQVELGVRRGFDETAAGPEANRNRQQQVQQEADAASRFADDLKRQGDLIARGFDTARPAVEEFAVKLEEDLQALGAAAKADRQNAKEFLEQRRGGLIEQAAPMLIDMAQARENAILQGPSRAALNASDVSTMQGQQELNRLLRGDDPAKDVNLAEMKTQTGRLSSIDEGIKKLVNQFGVAN